MCTIPPLKRLSITTWLAIRRWRVTRARIRIRIRIITLVLKPPYPFVIPLREPPQTAKNYQNLSPHATKELQEILEEWTSTRSVRHALIRAHTPHSFRHTLARTDRQIYTHTHGDESGLGGRVNARRRLCRARGRETKKNIVVVVASKIGLSLAMPPRRSEWRRTSPPRGPPTIGRDSGHEQQQFFLIQRTIGGVRRRRNDDDDHEQDDEESLATRA